MPCSSAPPVFDSSTVFSWMLVLRSGMQITLLRFCATTLSRFDSFSLSEVSVTRNSDALLAASRSTDFEIVLSSLMISPFLSRPAAMRSSPRGVAQEHKTSFRLGQTQGSFQQGLQDVIQHARAVQLACRLEKYIQHLEVGTRSAAGLPGGKLVD